MCTAGVRCGRWDLGVTSVLFPSYYRVSQVGATREEFPECMEIFHTLGELSPCGHVCCGVSPCGQELVRGEIQIFRYKTGGTWVFTILLPCGGQFFAFSTRKSLLTHTVPWCKGGISVLLIKRLGKKKAKFAKYKGFTVFSGWLCHHIRNNC